MQELTEVLANATAGIDRGYFRLHIDGGDPIYRERVYCYELYHQMRLRWPKGSPFYLNGEIDKAAHPILMKLGAAHAKPDLLVHQPGYMQGNHAVIEVKSSRAGSAGIKKDIRTLSLFRTAVGYPRAIYLIYGNNIGRGVRDLVERTAAELNGLAHIEVWLHEEAGKPAVRTFDLGNGGRMR